MQFVKANRIQRKLRAAILGPTGSGKTFSALKIARGIAGPTGRIALIDTENASASLYSDHVEFDTLQLTSFSPDQYVKAIRAAEDAGYDVLVVDSLSHAWAGKDGSLEQVDRKALQSRSGSSFEAWRHVTPEHNKMVEALVRCKMHLLVTMRVKTEYVMEKNDQGKMAPRKVGLSPVMRDGVEYEFDVVADMDKAVMVVSKTRYSPLHEAVITKPDETLGRDLIKWLSTGELPRLPDPADEPAAAAPEQPNDDPAPTQRTQSTSGKAPYAKITGPGEGEAMVVSVDHVKSSPEGHKDPWDLYRIVLERNGNQTELTAISPSVQEGAKLALAHKKPAACKWELKGNYQNLIECKPIGVPMPVVQKSTNVVPPPPGQRSKSIRDIVGTKDSPKP